MPGMSGAEVSKRIAEKRVDLPVLFITGFADRAALAGVSEAEILRKPFTDEELLEKVSFALMQISDRKLIPLRA
jgi:FixJ family two-component response regulator